MNNVLLGLSPTALSDAQRVELIDLVPDGRLVVTTDPDRMDSVLADVEVAAADVPKELLLRAPGLRWYQQWGAGADWLLDCPEIHDRGVIVTTGSGIHPTPISEHVFAMLLAFATGLPRAQRAQMRREWMRQRESELFELAGKTMLLVGLGAIGARTAQVAEAMGMRVVGVRRNPGISAPGVEVMLGPERLHEALPEADFVVLTVPLTVETRWLMGERELELMKPTAYLINVGRGGTVDQPSLERALIDGRIAGAGLDVFETEPLLDDSPLWDMENVIVTAHYAGITPHYDERAMRIFLDNLRRYRDGRQLSNVVDERTGY